jgi:DNA-binding transcriptional MocR family regulator
MASKPYKGHKKGVGRHVQLPEWVQASEAWATLRPGPRALYIELKRRFNGVNNGSIILSHRDAGKALDVHRNTVGPWFDALEERGFIRMTQAPHLGPSGIGQTSHWALEELPSADLKPASKRFMSWRQKQKPRTENRTGCHKKQDTKGGDTPQANVTVLKTVTR